MEPSLSLSTLLEKFSAPGYISKYLEEEEDMGFSRDILGMLVSGFGPVAEFRIHMVMAGMCLRTDFLFSRSACDQSVREHGAQ